MTTLLYRGHDYVQHKESVKQNEGVELTYRRNHYNNCRNKAKDQLLTSLTYRGIPYTR